MSTATSLPEVYQLHVWLREISPMIWRRLLVRSDSAIAAILVTVPWGCLENFSRRDWKK